MLRLYDFLPSGNCYKVRLLLTQLAIPFERIDLNILKVKPGLQSSSAKTRMVVFLYWKSNLVNLYRNQTQSFFM
jgi:glutathione S-transferase